MKRLLVLAVAVGSLVLPASAARLPVLASQDWWPVFSPDAQWIAFTRVDGRGRQFALDVVPRGGGRVRQLARATSQLDPSWSPDSRQLAYSAGGYVFTVNRDGTDRRLVAIGRAPAWSPDGSALAVVDGGELHVGSTVLATNVVGRPDWSTDGSEIAFARSDGIYAVTLAGGERLVAHTVGDAGSPVWSGDGNRIAFTDSSSIEVVRADGTSPAVAVAGPYHTIAPLSWSPTGDSILTTAGGRVVSVLLGTPPQVQLGGPSGVGADYAPGSLDGGDFAVSAPFPRCPGRDVHDRGHRRRRRHLRDELLGRRDPGRRWQRPGPREQRPHRSRRLRAGPRHGLGRPQRPADRLRDHPPLSDQAPGARCR
ncbi:MAG TPA: hypothetical protein VF094_00920 [Gaiellaceae bacterium]